MDNKKKNELEVYYKKKGTTTKKYNNVKIKSYYVTFPFKKKNV